MATMTLKSLSGRIACRGKATGRPKVVLSPKDLDTVGIGDILIAKQTDITFVPAMMRAAAIVTETGGRHSHPAIWSRENNKPCLLQVENATEFLAAVNLITVDANRGLVEWET
jgi:phosphohistidine swiveling domain-containing protein